MRSRIVVVAGRIVGLALATVVMCGTGAVGSAGASVRQAAPAAGGQQPGGNTVSQASLGLDDGIGGAVGIVAVSFGIGGMAVGTYRRRRGLVTQAEANQRR